MRYNALLLGYMAALSLLSWSPTTLRKTCSRVGWLREYASICIATT